MSTAIGSTHSAPASAGCPSRVGFSLPIGWHAQAWGRGHWPGIHVSLRAPDCSPLHEVEVPCGT